MNINKDLNKTVSILRCQGSSIAKTQDYVAIEHPFTVILNGEELLHFVCTPHMLRELTLGLLLSQGVIRTLDDVRTLEVGQDCGVVWLKDGFTQRKPKLLSIGPVFQAHDLLQYSEMAARKGALFLKTGGAHYGGIYIGQELCCFAEDISRKNALAKALGGALLERKPLGGVCLITSGRVSEEIALMAIHAGVSTLVSRSAPTHMAIAVAQKYNLTLCGFVRGNRMNIYAGKERIEF